MAMILTESGFVTRPENKPESMFKVGNLIRPKLNNQFDGMSTDQVWKVTEVGDYDRMNGYIYTIKPENDAAKTYRGENSTDGEAEGFAEIAGFESSPEEQCWTLVSDSVTSLKELHRLNKLVDAVAETLQICNIAYGIAHIKDGAVEAEIIEDKDLDKAINAFNECNLKFELVDDKTFRFELENQGEYFKESFDYDETSEEDQGLFDGIGTKIVDTLFPGVQFEPAEMEKLDDAIDKLIYVYKSVKARTAEPVKESVSKDIDTLLDIAGGKDEVEQRIIDALRNYPNADAEELAEILEDDNLSYDDWTSIIEYLDIDF